MSEPPPKTSIYDSPFRLLGIIAASEFVSDALVIVILGILPPVPPVVGALLDATLLTIFIYPIF